MTCNCGGEHEENKCVCEGEVCNCGGMECMSKEGKTVCEPVSGEKKNCTNCGGSCEEGKCAVEVAKPELE